MILEGIVTTVNEDGTTNVSPMGPEVDGDPFTQFTLRPFVTSVTYTNLKRTGDGVLHVTDDVLLLARAAIGNDFPMPEFLPDQPTNRRVLASCCHWFAFDAVEVDDSNQRAVMNCGVVDQGVLRSFFGFNRAKHAVLEAAILATRLHLLPINQVEKQYADLQVLVEKTAGPNEEEAFAFLKSYVEAYPKQNS